MLCMGPHQDLIAVTDIEFNPQAQGLIIKLVFVLLGKAKQHSVIKCCLLADASLLLDM